MNKERLEDLQYRADRAQHWVQIVPDTLKEVLDHIKEQDTKLEAVKALADRIDRHTEREAEEVEARDPDGSWYGVADALREALEQ